jgi:hypothetical protein
MVMPIARGHIHLDPRVGYAIGVVEFEDLYELRGLGNQGVGVLQEDLAASEVQPSRYALNGLAVPPGLAQESP